MNPFQKKNREKKSNRNKLENLNINVELNLKSANRCVCKQINNCYTK